MRFVQHVGIHIQAVKAMVSLQNTVVQATFQGSVYLRKDVVYIIENRNINDTQ